MVDTTCVVHDVYGAHDMGVAHGVCDDHVVYEVRRARYVCRRTRDVHTVHMHLVRDVHDAAVVRRAMALSDVPKAAASFNGRCLVWTR